MNSARADAKKQIVLVLDRADWHSTQRLHVPDHLHLPFLPPYSPEPESAEHLWPLTNMVLRNRHFASIEELEDAQAAHCVALVVGLVATFLVTVGLAACAFQSIRRGMRMCHPRFPRQAAQWRERIITCQCALK